ncbi:MAG: glycosyltransferase, partial [Bullifex sp.]
SRMIADQLVKHHYKAELRVISNGIDPAFVYHKEEKSDELKGKFVIVMSGRFSHEKRQDLIIDAVKKSKHEKDIQLFLAGQGPVEAEYRKRAEGLTNPIIMRFLTKDQLISLFGKTDLYVHASDAEIEAMSCMEAFASGLVPIISDSKRSATPQFALDGRSLFRAGDSNDLAEKIDYWMEHEDERRTMEKKYAEHAEKYALENCVLQMEEMFADEIRKHESEKSR